MAKGYSARRGFTTGSMNGGSAAARQQDMQQKIAQMQEEMAATQAKIEETLFSASVGGGVVAATVTGKKELKTLTISPEAVDPQDVEMLQDLVVSAVNEAIRQAEDAMTSGMESLSSGLNLGALGL